MWYLKLLPVGKKKDKDIIIDLRKLQEVCPPFSIPDEVIKREGERLEKLIKDQLIKKISEELDKQI